MKSAKSVLGLALTAIALFVGLVVTGIGINAVLKPSIKAIFGPGAAQDGFFYFALIALSLIVYFILLVGAIRAWEDVLKVRFLETFNHARKDSKNT